jgi:hypothetical protein
MKKTTRLVTRAFTQMLDKAITLNLLKCFRHLAQAASRLACVLGVTATLLLATASYAVAPIHDGIQIQQTPKMYAKAVLPIDEFKCIGKLYGKESAWKEDAQNGPHYGIPQGRSIYLKTATGIQQVKWGISYNLNRYGSMCAAWEFFQKNNYH